MSALKRALMSVGLGLATAAGVAPACSGDKEGNGSDADGGGQDGSGGNASGSDGATNASGNGNDNGNANSVNVTATGGVDLDTGSDGGTGVGCAGETTDAVPVPLDLYFMVDSSGSMRDTTDGSTTKWEAVRGALTSFFMSDGLSDVGVGMQFFPQIKEGVPEQCSSDAECGAGGPCFLRACAGVGDYLFPCGSDADCILPATTGEDADFGPCLQFGACEPGSPTIDEIEEVCMCPTADIPDVTCEPLISVCMADADCEAAAYVDPAVEVAPLSESGPALISALNGVVPRSTTPTSGALAGAIDYLSQRAQDYPERQMITVLATDGFPSEDCVGPGVETLDDATLEVAAVAEGAAQANPAIRTFVIGVFTPEDAETAQIVLDYVAAAGGTEQAFVIETSSDVAGEFEAALDEIRSAAITCDFEMPVPSSGTLDYQQINVQLSTGGDPDVLFYVASASECGDEPGWYYDVDPATGGTPSHITLCEASCQAFKSGGSLNIELGCDTIVK